jgi:hypothetical protein
MESISQENRRRLSAELHRVAQTRELTVHLMQDGQINELVLDPCAS